MSSVRGASVEIHGEQNTSMHERSEGAANEPPRAVNGSLVAKLFANATLPRAAVGADDQVEAHGNGVNQGDSAGSEDELDGAINGKGLADGVDVEDQEDDEDDDEYDPNEASEADYSDDSDDSGSDLDDEETSMRSLLLPMATYAKQLLFLSDEEDNGEFDEQDAELWASGQDKHAWIARYEAANRAFEQKYGCRIDSPAIPEVKRKLRRERKREGKYSIVLVVLAVAYFIRLMVGGPTSTIAPTPTQTTVVTEAEKSTATPTQTHVHVMDANHPLWWTTWTENLVVRVVTWPAQYFSSQTTTTVVKQPVKRRKEVEAAPPAPPSIDPSTKPAPAEKMPLADVDVVEESGHGETIVRPEDTTQHVAVNAVVDEVEKAPTVEVVVEVEGSEVEVVLVGEPADSETPATPALPGNPEQHTVTTPSITSETDSAVVESDATSQESPAEDVMPQPATPGLLAQCSEQFYKVIKTKNDADLKTSAIEACDAAVQASAAEDMPIERIQAHVIRGDLQSLLYSFGEARGDYEVAIAHAQTSDLSADARAMMELKLAANRWIELYQTKQFKELRSECERVVASADSGGAAFTTTSDHMRGVASEWLRVFKRETKLMDVLIKTRAWTISPLKLQ